MPFSASTAEALPLRAGYLLRWEIINRLRNTQARWLDLGGDEGDDGLRHFKTGNVGTLGRIADIPGEFDSPGHTLELSGDRRNAVGATTPLTPGTVRPASAEPQPFSLISEASRRPLPPRMIFESGIRSREITFFAAAL